MSFIAKQEFFAKKEQENKDKQHSFHARPHSMMSPKSEFGVPIMLIHRGKAEGLELESLHSDAVLSPRSDAVSPRSDAVSPGSDVVSPRSAPATPRTPTKPTEEPTKESPNKSATTSAEPAITPRQLEPEPKELKQQEQKEQKEQKEPKEPKEPKKPMEPKEPEEPKGSTEPKEISEPAKPKQHTEPAESTEPTEPTEPKEAAEKPEESAAVHEQVHDILKEELTPDQVKRAEKQKKRDLKKEKKRLSDMRKREKRRSGTEGDFVEKHENSSDLQKVVEEQTDERGEEITIPVEVATLIQTLIRRCLARFEYDHACMSLTHLLFLSLPLPPPLFLLPPPNCFFCFFQW